MKQRELTDEAFLNIALEYFSAANRLFPVAKDVKSPIYFLYAHTIELAFKAYLNSRGCSVPKIHNLESLCKSCHNQGLHVDRELVNVIHLLESENKVHGFRYFAFASTGIPEIGYLRQVVDDLLPVVAETLKRGPSKAAKNEVVLKFIVGRPEKKVQS